MANITTNLGPVSAYLDAVAHGYKGTREEFGEYLAHVGDNAAAAAESARQAAASESSAESSATAADESATAAAGSATAADGSATDAGNAQTAAEAAKIAAQTAQSGAEAAQGAAEDAQTAAEAAQAAAEAVLESIPEDYSEMSADVSVLMTESEYLHESVMGETVPYGIWDSTTNAGFTVVQTGDTIKISGTSAATAGQLYTKLLICDHVQTWNAATDPDSVKVYPISAIAGHHYRIALSVISGTRDAGTGTGNMIISYGMEGTLQTGRVLPIDSDYAELDFDSTGDPFQLRLRIARLMTVTNLVVRVTVRDITAELRDAVPLPDSTNPVESGGTFAAIAKVEDAIGHQIRPITLPSYTANAAWEADGTSTGITATIRTINNWRAYDPIPIAAGDRFTIIGTDPSSTKTNLVLITDDDLKVLQRVGERTDQLETYSFVAVGGATKMLITQKASVVPILTQTVIGQPECTI